MTDQQGASIKKIRREALAQLTEDGKKQVRAEVAKLWNNNKLTRDSLCAIAATILLME